MKSDFNLSQDICKLTDLEEVEKYTHSDKWLIRQEAIKRLGEIGDSKSIKRLIEILKKSKDQYDLVYANSALGRLKAKAAVPVLLTHINSRKIDVACSAIYALGEIGDSSVILDLERLEKNRKDDRIVNYCKTALKKLSEKVR